MRNLRLSLRCRRSLVVLAVAAVAAAALTLPARSPSGQEPPGKPEAAPEERVSPEVRAMGWKGVEKLISEQKLRAAEELVGELREQAKGKGNQEEWTRALVEQVRLQIALAGYETAVRFLRQQEWPSDPQWRAVLDLYYAYSLTSYVNAYSWEIRGRERVESAEEVDLKAWTMDRIAEEILRAYAELWKQRDAWGSEPLGDLARYVNQNNYPPRIRGTLRDAVTYLWVEQLADTALWRPEQSNELFRLDFKALVAGDPAASSDIALEDPRVHPLLKIGSVLADLEAWHRAARRPEAALEARLERVRRLQSSFSNAADQELLRTDLAERMGSFDRDLEWWSMGQAELAELLRGSDAPDAEVRARDVALAGAEAHPQSIGGLRCRHFVAAIEAPFYALAAMSSDGLNRRSLQVTHRNLAQVHFRAFRVDVEETIATARDYNLLPGYREVQEILAKRQPDASWSVDLPPTPDYRSHVTYVIPPMQQSGAYLVVASARRDFSESANTMVGVNLVLGDLVLVTRQLEGTYEVTVRSGKRGQPVAGATVTLYRYDWQRGHRKAGQAVTGEDGVVKFGFGGWDHSQHFLLATYGEDLALDQSALWARPETEPGEQTSAFLYTDRSVYRPLQTLHFKVVAYRGDARRASFSTLADTKLTVSLHDANGEEVSNLGVTTNDFGSASGELTIPAGRLLGQWQLAASIGGATAVRVEEYKRPTFEVKVKEPEVALRLNRPATMNGEVRYYFGLPVTSGTVDWRVSREPVYPPWWYWWGKAPAVQTQVVASGEGKLDSDGRFTVTFTPAADEREAASGVSYRYRLSTDVTDEGGETRSAERVFRLGFVSVEARISSDVGFLREKEPAELTVSRSDLDGVPRKGHGSWKLVELVQPEKTLLPADQPLPEAPAETGAKPYRTEGDRQRPRWAPDYSPEAVMSLWGAGKVVASGEVEHGEDGVAKLILPKLDAGTYRLLYTTKDDFGAVCEARQELLVAGAKKTPVALPALLLVEQGSVPVGGTVRLLVRSGLPEQEMELELFRDGKRTERRLLRSGWDAELVELPVTESDRGGFGVTLTLLRDHQLMRQSAAVSVPWSDRELKLELATFRDTLRPGSKETFKVVVHGADGKAVAAGVAEVLAYMYDRSLDIFAPHTPPLPLSVYPNRISWGQLQASLGAAFPAWQSETGLASIPGYPELYGDSLKSIDGYGIGGPGARGHMMFKSRMMAGAVAEAIPPPAPAAEPMAADQAVAPQGAVAASTATQSTVGVLMEQQIAAAPAPSQAPTELRANFSETAFFQPSLVTAADGSVSIEFEVPDSVTDWNLWLHAFTRDLRSGSLNKQTRSVKELMVRPYLPRFLREGDRAELKVVVNNAGESELTGTADLEILDPESNASLLDLFGISSTAAHGVPFTVAPGKGTNLTFPITVPARVGTVAFKITARAGDFSDGEQRPLPVLPGRMHLVQSRFVTLKDADRRELTFADMARGDDPTLINDQLVVTVDAQLFYGVLNALPYLVNYPYECTEQTLNRFVSTGMVASLYGKYPAVERMAEKMAKRETRFESFAAPDPNRTMALEETPWLVEAKGGKEEPEGLINVLDPRITRAQRDDALAKLKKAQTSLGAFPWWPGGPPSPYMTLYLLAGLSRALEFGVEVPKDMVVNAWGYMHRHYLDELVRDMMKEDCCWETITYLNFVLSSYPDESWTGGVFTEDERARMLAFSFGHWKEHSPLLKGYLALTLERSGRAADAKLVFDSVMDSAITTPDEGTYWAAEDRSWLWYNDTIEGHAFALRTLTELQPDDARRHGLVQWLLLNKKLNHWKSTRATAEVLYALVHYLEREGALGVREEALVTVGPKSQRFVFEPDEYTGGRNQLVIPGPEVDPATMSTTVVEKSGKGFAFASATWHFSTEKLPEEARGDLFAVERHYFRRQAKGDEWVLEPIAEGAKLEVGDQVEVQLSIRAKHAAEYVHLRDPRGAGFEPESATSQFKWDLGLGYYEEIRDSGTNFFFEWLPAGEYTFRYRLRAAMAGSFKVAPATLQSMYAPEFAAYSAGNLLAVEGGK